MNPVIICHIYNESDNLISLLMERSYSSIACSTASANRYAVSWEGFPILPACPAYDDGGVTLRGRESRLEITSRGSSEEYSQHLSDVARDSLDDWGCAAYLSVGAWRRIRPT